MKRLLAKSILLAGGMTASSQLLALGLGEINLDSALNQPFRAEIQMIDSADLTSAEIRPKLASADDFDRAGVERYQFLTQMKFSVNGDRIMVTTRDPINEPFINFLVELNWPAGRVLREYTVLLDPPVFQETTINPLVAVPAGSVIENRTTATAPAPAPKTQPAPRAQSNDQWARPAEPGTYKVQPNDTLWKIALATRPDASVSPQQMMIALQDVNPDAFINGNINRLKTHTVLDIPDESIIRTVAQREAVAEVQRQNREVSASVAQIDATGRAASTGSRRESSTGGEVRLVSSSGDGRSEGASGAVAGSAGQKAAALENDLAIALENLDKSRRENQELAERMAALQEQLATMESLIALQNDKMANLQVNAADSVAAKTEVAPSETAPVAGPATEVATPVAEGQAVSVVETAPETAGDAAAVTSGTAESAEAATDYNYAGDTAKAQDEAAAAEAKAAEEARMRMLEERRKAMEQAAQQPAPADDFMSFLMNLPKEVLALALGGLLVLVYAVMRLRKSKKEEEEADELLADGGPGIDSFDNDSFDNDAFDKTVVAGFDQKDDLPSFDTQPLSHDFQSDNLDDFELHQDDLGEMPVADDLGDLDLDNFDDAESDRYETVGQTEDAISESDIYIAYGKFDQAVDLLNKAILAEPERIDLRLKLLEVLSSVDDSEKFAAVEAGLIALGNPEANEKARDLRNQLSSPVVPMVAGAGLSLDGDIPSLDEEADSEFAGGMDFGDALDFGDDLTPEDDGIGAALEEVPELELGESSDFNAEAEGIEMSLEEDQLELDDDLLEFALDESDDEELVASDDVVAVNETPADDFGSIRFESDAPAAQDTDSFEIEFASEEVVAADNSGLDDLVTADDDVLTLDGDDFAGLELDDDVVSLDETTAVAPESAEELAMDLDLGPVSDDADVALELDDFGSDLEELAADEVVVEVEDDTELTAPESVVEAVAEVAPAAAYDFDADLESGDADLIGGIDLDELAAADDEFDFLAGSDESATKLDLARAYIDMEDFDGARELLQEVASEGNDQQKQDARDLLDNLA